MRLYFLRLARGKASGAPIPGYLIQTDDGTNILIDTGLPADPAEGLGGRREGFEAGPEDFVVAQLARLGLSPRDIRYVVSTHFDLDHAGGHDAFPEAEHVSQRAHYEAARAGLPRAQLLRSHWDHPALRYRLLDGDTELAPGVELIETSGHAVGHQSVLVRLPETGPVVLAIDAIPHSSMLDPDTRAIQPFDEDEALTRASTRKLVDLARREGAAMLVHGHDAGQWATLKLAPEFYG